MVLKQTLYHMQDEGSLQPVWTTDGRTEAQVPGETRSQSRRSRPMLSWSMCRLLLERRCWPAWSGIGPCQRYMCMYIHHCTYHSSLSPCDPYSYTQVTYLQSTLQSVQQSNGAPTSDGKPHPSQQSKASKPTKVRHTTIFFVTTHSTSVYTTHNSTHKFSVCNYDSYWDCKFCSPQYNA